ncbi:MAG: DNA repair protein RecO [Burkholderiaceae bacterium]|nr:DNA repair protein RecO [Burkholderiaceae bacterium]
MTRVSNEPAFLLHATPYSETSLVVDLFTRDYGRVAAIAKGARRPRSALRAVLLQFQALTVSFSGRGELRTLTAAEWAGGAVSPRGDALLYAFYLNELLVRLLPREDSHPALYDAYSEAIAALCREPPFDEALRRFEWRTLREIGYAPDLQRDSSRRAIEANSDYHWSPAEGFVLVAGEPGAGGANDRSIVRGTTLLGLGAGRIDTANGRSQAKYLTRAILAHHLDGVVLKTRQILVDLQKL